MTEFINDLCISCANGSFDTCDTSFEQVTFDGITREIVDCDNYIAKPKRRLKITYECDGMIATEVKEVYELPKLAWQKQSINSDEVKEIIDYLNKKSGKSYRSSSKKLQQLIKARASEKFTVDDFKRVIDNKVTSWGKDPKMAQYLRPSTLFGTKFEEYLNETPVKSPDKLQSKPSYDLEKIKQQAYYNTEI